MILLLENLLKIFDILLALLRFCFICWEENDEKRKKDSTFLYKGEKKRCYKRRRIDCHWKSFHSETQHSVKISKIYSHIMLYQFLTSNILINTRNWFHVIFFNESKILVFSHCALSHLILDLWNIFSFTSVSIRQVFAAASSLTV